MTDDEQPEYWVAGTFPDTAGRRRLHTDRDCFHLDRATTVRPAWTGEDDDLEICEVCAGETIGNPEGGDFSHYNALVAAAEEGTDP